MTNHYLKCKYYENSPMMLFSNEYLVTFKSLGRGNPKILLGRKVFPPKGKDYCIVCNGDVIPLDKNRGLVRLATLQECEDEKNVSVGIYDKGDRIKDNWNRRISFFKVPLEEIEVR